jgi:release factor-specific protein-(glutamine-N5) methyltransferase
VTWTVASALAWCRDYLAEKADENPRLSAEWLLSAATGLSRVELYTCFDRPLSEEERSSLREGVKRRGAGEPLQYVTGEVAFRHIVVKVRPGVLIPRPETEVLVGEALCGVDAALAAHGEARVADLCTGSGCVGLAIAAERVGARVWAGDVSPDAVEVARDNAQRLALAERFSAAEGDLFAALPAELLGTLDVVVANPPYIPSADVPDLPAEVAGFEPHLALDGGADGLAVARRIWNEATRWLRPRGLLALELDERMVQTAAKEVVEWYRDAEVVSDLAGRDRVLVAKAGIREGQTSS